ncbi:MAG: hypothetical protein U1F56_01815 [Rubrivivax sp.]
MSRIVDVGVGHRRDALDQFCDPRTGALLDRADRVGTLLVRKSAKQLQLANLIGRQQPGSALDRQVRARVQ